MILQQVLTSINQSTFVAFHSIRLLQKASYFSVMFWLTLGWNRGTLQGLHSRGWRHGLPSTRHHTSGRVSGRRSLDAHHLLLPPAEHLRRPPEQDDPGCTGDGYGGGRWVQVRTILHQVIHEISNRLFLHLQINFLLKTFRIISCES